MPSALATTPGVDIIVPVGSRERHVVSEARLEAAADVSGPIGAGFFVLRAPALPIDLLQAALSRDTSGEETSSECDRALQDWIADPWVRTALYLASPTLVDRLADWAAHPTDERFARIRPALFRYFIRITSRPTPFGLFASFTTGRVGRSLEVALGPRDALRRSSWLDLGFLYPLVARAVDGAGVRKTLRYVANSSVSRHCARGAATISNLRRLERDSRRHLGVLPAWQDRCRTSQDHPAASASATDQHEAGE
jgi:hypothetical protein